MNVKKYLKKQAEQQKQEILNSDNGERLRDLQNMVEEKPKKRPKLRVWLPATLSAVTAAAVVLTCVIIYYPTENERIEYLDANLISVDSTLEELNKDVKEVELQVDSAIYSYTVKKTSDLVSGDVLFYITTIKSLDTFVKMDIVNVCNPNYKYKDFNLPNNPTTTKLTNYTVSYKISTSINEEFGLETLHASAEIHKGKEYIYVTNYSEMLLTPDGSFLEILQSIVK